MKLEPISYAKKRPPAPRRRPPRYAVGAHIRSLLLVEVVGRRPYGSRTSTWVYCVEAPCRHRAEISQPALREHECLKRVFRCQQCARPDGHAPLSFGDAHRLWSIPPSSLEAR